MGFRSQSLSLTTASHFHSYSTFQHKLRVYFRSPDYLVGRILPGGHKLIFASMFVESKRSRTFSEGQV